MTARQPSGDDTIEAIERQNPWHELDRVPERWAPAVERALAGLMPRLLTGEGVRRFQFIVGPRRVGKTTVMYQTVRHLLDLGVPARRLWSLRLDHPSWLEVPLDRLVGAILDSTGASAASPAYLFLDELAYAADWDLWLKTFYDEDWPVRIVATSSSTAALRNRRLESGIGRWEERYLAPWLFPEYLRLRGVPLPAAAALTLEEAVLALLTGGRANGSVQLGLKRYLLVGGFPELLTLPLEDEIEHLLESQRVLRTDAVDRAIYKDIPQVFSITEPMKLERLLYVLAGQFTGQLSPSAIAASLGLTQPTVDKYIGYLERAFLVFTLPNYAPSEETVQRRGRKLYFVDGAVRNAALQRGIRPRDDEAELGHLRENAVAAHLHALSAQTGARLYHWRDRQLEVDLVYDDGEHPFAFEVGSSVRHSTRSLEAFCERFPRFRSRGYLVAPGVQPVAADRGPAGIGRLPLEWFLVAVGRATEAALVASATRGGARARPA